MTTVMPCSSRYLQSSILGERNRQPASSRQMMFISEAPPCELLLARAPVDVERVAFVVAQVDSHPLAGLVRFRPFVLGQRFEHHFSMLRTKGVLAAVPWKVQGPEAAVASLHR